MSARGGGRRLLGLLLALTLGATTPAALLAAEDDGPRATLSWKAKDDEGLYGYLVYRSEQREGPFLRVNREIVHVVPANDEGVATYTWIDTDVVPGRTYYYYLDTLGTTGLKQRFSGVVAKTVAER